MIKLILHGCNGQMGRTITQLAAKQDEVRIVAGIDKFPESVSQLYPVFGSVEECNIPADVVVDFSRPEALDGLVAWCLEKKYPLLVATTGLDEREERLLDTASGSIPIFHSANMSLGINLLCELLKKAADFLGEGFDVEIIEKHHNKKVDAPSGTALLLADAVNSQYHGEKEYIYGRHSKTQRRQKQEIGIHAIRGGTIVGEHQVHFIGEDEIIELTHIAQSKQIFAVGALRAAVYLASKTAGMYRMGDMLSKQEQ